jgi:hypothetical protein
MTLTLQHDECSFQRKTAPPSSAAASALRHLAETGRNAYIAAVDNWPNEPGLRSPSSAHVQSILQKSKDPGRPISAA